MTRPAEASARSRTQVQGVARHCPTIIPPRTGSSDTSLAWVAHETFFGKSDKASRPLQRALGTRIGRASEGMPQRRDDLQAVPSTDGEENVGAGNARQCNLGTLARKHGKTILHLLGRVRTRTHLYTGEAAD